MNIILFDGDCHFCNASVQFIIKRDQMKYFKFASLQSEIGRTLLKKFQIPETIDSMVFIEGNNYYVKSTAALKIAKRLDGMWPLLLPFITIPSFLRDLVYDIIAKNRHSLRKHNACKIPDSKDLDRFLH